MMIRAKAKEIHDKKEADPIAVYTFDCMGYAILRNVMNMGLVQKAKTIVDQIFPNEKEGKFPILHLDRVFWELLTSPALMGMAEKLCGDEFRLDHAFGVSSDNGIINLHGGANCSQRTCFAQWVGDSNILVGQLSVGVPLAPQSPETGGVCFIPGSHKAFDQRDGRAIKQDLLRNHFNHDCVVVPALNPGDLIVFSESLIHGNTGWKPKDYCRLQLYYKFCPGFMAWRDPVQQEKYRQYAKTDLEKRLIEPAWSGRFSDDTALDQTNLRRSRTIQ